VLDLSEHAHHLVEIDEHTLQRSVEDVARAALNKLAQSLSARGVQAASALRFGRAWEELSRQAIAEGHDLVIVGTRGKKTASRLLFGSTAQKLIRFCPAPVWIAKPGQVREIREVVVGTDFSDAAFAALQAAVSLVQAVPAKLWAVHALESPMDAYLRTAGVTDEAMTKYRDRMRDDAKQKLQAQLMQTDARTLKYGVLAEVLEGSPDTVLPQFIDQNEVDLLVIGTHGRSGIAGALLGNTAERMLPYVNCSLLAIKPPGFAGAAQH
jgi:nucleotide-binding universal stress UspA family protein